MTDSLVGSATLAHVISAISAGSAAHAERARIKLSNAQLPHVLQVGVALAAAQHSAHIRYQHPRLLIVAGDDRIADPGIDLGEHHPTRVAAAMITQGAGAVCQLARNAGAALVLVGVGMQAPLVHDAVVHIAGGASAAFATDVAALTLVDVAILLEAGIALMLSIKEQGCDVLALGSIGLGAVESSAAIAGALYALSGTPLPALPRLDEDLHSFVQMGHHVASTRVPTLYETAEQFAGRETIVLVGVILCAASMNVPVIIDDGSTVVAAALAFHLAPAVHGSIIAAHHGRGLTPHLLHYMHMTPVFDSILGNGEGSAAAMVLAFAQTAAALTV